MNTDTPDELEKFWTAHIDTWKATDLTQRAYCQQHNLAVHRFSYWKRKLTASDEPLPETRGFVQIKPMPLSHSTLAVQLSNQIRIEGISSDKLPLVKLLAGVLQ